MSWIFFMMAVLAQSSKFDTVYAQYGATDDLIKQMWQIISVPNSSGPAGMGPLTNLEETFNMSQSSLDILTQLFNLRQLPNFEPPPTNDEGIEITFDTVMQYLKTPLDQQEMMIEMLRQSDENLTSKLNETIRELQFHQNQQSFVLVLDLAMSPTVYEDIEIPIQQVVSLIANSTFSPVFNYIFVGFDHQGFQPPLVTTNQKKFLQACAKQISQPKSAPKKIMGALKAAIEAAIPRSNIFVITDSPASDGSIVDSVQKIVESKQSSITFMLASTKPVDTSYDKLVKFSNGNLLFLVDELMLTIPPVVLSHLDTNKRLINSVDLKKHETVKFPVDNTISEFTVLLTGLNSKFSLIDPKNDVYNGKPTHKNSNMTIVRVADPMKGQWTINANAEVAAYLRITATTSAVFSLGFSTELPNEFVETITQPKQATNSVLTVQLVEETMGITLTQVTVEALDGSTKYDLHRIKTTNMFATEAFRQPNWFKVYVHGIDTEGSQVKRLISTTIRPINDNPLIVNVIAAEVLVIEDQPVELKCTVSSLVPVEIQWRRGDIVLSKKESKQSNELIYRISNANLSDTGEYACSAASRAGLETKKTQIGVIPALLMIPPESLQVEINMNKLIYVESVDLIIVDCLVKGPATNVFWQFDGQQLNDKFVMANNTLNLGPAKRSYSGRYTCIAESPKKSAADSIDIVVHYPPTLEGPDRVPINTSVNNNLTLKCETEGMPRPNIRWSHKNQKYDSTTSFLELNSITFDDEGLYTCTADNGISPTATRDFIIMVMAVEAPIMSGNKNITAKVGETATLVCVCDICKPIRSHYWTSPKHDRIEQSAHHQISTKDLQGVDKFETNLTISDLTPADSGVYRCHMANDKGETGYSINLNLEGVPFITLPTTTTSAKTPTTTTTSEWLQDNTQPTNTMEGIITTTTTTSTAEDQIITTAEPDSGSNSGANLCGSVLCVIFSTFVVLVSHISFSRY